MSLYVSLVTFSDCMIVVAVVVLALWQHFPFALAVMMTTKA